MLTNNLGSDVADKPDELLVYADTGKAYLSREIETMTDTAAIAYFYSAIRRRCFGLRQQDIQPPPMLIQFHSGSDEANHFTLGSISAFGYLSAVDNVENTFSVTLLTSTQAYDAGAALPPRQRLAITRRSLSHDTGSLLPGYLADAAIVGSAKLNHCFYLFRTITS